MRSHICAREENAFLCSEKRDRLQAEELPVSATRIVKITENLYECPPDGAVCPHRFAFAYKNYCSWLLNKPQMDLSGNELTPPCFVRGEKRKNAV